MQRKGSGQTLLSVGSVIAAVASLSCCVIPFALFLAGISGAWIANLTALAPYKPYFVAAALALIGVGFYFVYREPKVACVEGSYCARPASGRIAKGMLWFASALVILSLVFPYAVQLIYRE